MLNLNLSPPKIGYWLFSLSILLDGHFPPCLPPWLVFHFTFMYDLIVQYLVANAWNNLACHLPACSSINNYNFRSIANWALSSNICKAFIFPIPYLFHYLELKSSLFLEQKSRWVVMQRCNYEHDQKTYAWSIIFFRNIWKSTRITTAFIRL